MNLEHKRKLVQLKKLQASMEELEFKILEREEDIRRIKENIEKQLEAINELQSELKE